ncbi:secondary thiamine-phosphate synthase enzyme YjbQ [Marichromatium gracile]|uniref:secondary thiamine-phosphate synthase enzyme YjbQ n=1 Tax=Marichromatium gracile TaxID=1048 RepID=UPI001EEEE91D|nr:secondary thiamine-phosphate synthase enzyme YjbQ [Marichromatium gracile]MCF1184847.1 secondary thiamine-phosphate synthase enzyme YjbQ [Marichromatium gracile]
MHFHHERLPLRTASPIEIIDITAEIRQVFEKNSVREGQVTIHSPHTTAFVALNERETMLQQDMLAFLSRLAPKSAGYGHDQAPIDGRENAHAHLIGLFMNASETIPVHHGELLLGRWQSIFFVELDGPRESRTLNIQISGVR